MGVCHIRAGLSPAGRRWDPDKMAKDDPKLRQRKKKAGIIRRRRPRGSLTARSHKTKPTDWLFSEILHYKLLKVVLITITNPSFVTIANTN